MKIEKKEKMKHSIFSNVLYMVGMMFRISPGLVVGEIVVEIAAHLPQRLISVLGIKYLIDAVASGAPASQIITAAVTIAVTIVVSMLVKTMFFELFCHKERERLYLEFHSRLYEKAAGLDLSAYDDPEFYNDFILAVNTSSENIRFILNNLRGYISEIISFLSISAVMLSIDPGCLGITLALVLVSIPFGRATGNLNMKWREKRNELHRKGGYFARLFYLQDYAAEVRMNDVEPLLEKRFDESMDDIVSTAKKMVAKRDGVLFFQNISIEIIGMMLLLALYLGYGVIVKKSISMGDFVAAINGAASIAISLEMITTWALQSFTERSKMIEKYRVFLAHENPMKDGENTADCGEAQAISLKNVSFTYPGNDEPTLKNISMDIQPGKKIALVGYNGAGKTTLTNLLLRLYDVSEGAIEIGGRDIRGETIASHRNRFAAVFQDFRIFGATVGENVAMSPEYDAERVDKALEASGFDKPLDGGADTMLLREFDENGVMLSGGESQKIAIARAFYKRCPYVILDEPSANLDPVSEFNLNHAVMEKAAGRTVVFISHRLSTTRNADEIYMMENGEIVEHGTHSELMELQGKYAYMFNLQAKKYNI